MSNSEVRSVMLYGVPIIALVMDGIERLCLAQISNTLLKSFSYNEIHNRRVALGITCIQCTPVQLELLRRAGAMPVSSRRCGMITKREAERLCKSFLAETKPPKLPENFAFDVYHHCAWGSKGSFMPSRYNSSRAKCIKCTLCGLFFSPNKFIFHSHRLPDSKYVQPDAANFNSWRRHIKLAGDPSEEVCLVWEDVKAMFNGGSRKRSMPMSFGGSQGSSCNSSSQLNNNTSNTSPSMTSYEESGKKARLASPPTDDGPSNSPHNTVDSTVHRILPSSSSGHLQSASSLNQNHCLSLPPITAKNQFASLISSNQPFTGLPAPSAALGLTATSGGNHIRSPLHLAGSGQGLAVNHRSPFADLMWSASNSIAGKPAPWSMPYSCVLWPKNPLPSSDVANCTSNSGGVAGAGLGPLSRVSSDLFSPYSNHEAKSNLSDRLIAPESNPWLVPIESAFLMNSQSSRAVLEERTSSLTGSPGSGHVLPFKPVSKFPSLKFAPATGDEVGLTPSSSLGHTESTESVDQSPDNTTDHETDVDVDVIGNEDEMEGKVSERKSRSSASLINNCRNSDLSRKNYWSKHESDRKTCTLSHSGDGKVDMLQEKGEAEERLKQSSILKTLSNTPLNLTAFSKEHISRLMFNGPETRERLEKEFESMQSMMIANGFKGPATAAGPTIAADAGYGLAGDLFEGAYRNDFLKRDEFQKRFVQLFNNYVDTFRSDLHHLRN